MGAGFETSDFVKEKLGGGSTVERLFRSNISNGDNLQWQATRQSEISEGIFSLGGVEL